MRGQSGSSDITFAPEPETEDKAITLEIAPAGRPDTADFYYGRVNTTPNWLHPEHGHCTTPGASLSEDNQPFLPHEQD